MNEALYRAPAEVGNVGKRVLPAGLVILAVCAAGAFASPAQFFRSYLLGYLFWSGIALGCLAIMMVHYLSGGSWGLVIRRVLESAAATLPLMAILFLPVLLGAKQLYRWTDESESVASHAIHHKQAYLNLPFFGVRAAIYFLIWIGIATILLRWSHEQDRTANPRLSRKLQLLSGPGLVLYGLTVTFASVDWVMSLDPEWFSTIFGILFMGGQALSALAFVIVVAVLLSFREPMNRVVSASHFHDLGKLLLALVMLWAYFAFSQFLIIWSGNLPEETPWYLRRLQGGWQWIGIVVIVLHFVLPFLLLLSRDLKRNAHMLAYLAGGIIVMRLVDLFWLTAPEFHLRGFTVHWMDVLMPLGIGGVWTWFFARHLRRSPLLPLNDPYLHEALEHGRE